MAGDWLKLHRQALDSRVFSDAAAWRLFCYLLMTANWKTGYFEGEKIEPGQLATSYDSITAVIGGNKSRTRRLISKLEKFGCITKKPTRRALLITICNWRTYQQDDNQNRHPSEHPTEQSTDTLVSTLPTPIEEGKKERREEGKKHDIAASAAPACDEVLESWNSVEGVTHCRKLTANRRKALKARLSDSDWRENWKAGLEKVRGSPFCRGQGNRNWKADIDWFLRPDTVTRLLEGKYDGSTSGNSAISSGSGFVRECDSEKF